MAMNRIFAGHEKNNTFGVVPDDTVAGDPVWWGSLPAVAITNRGDATQTTEVGSMEITVPNGGVGLEDDEASLATDGTYHLEVGEVLAASAPANGTPVYAVGDDPEEAVELTLDGDDGSGTDYVRFGVINAPNNYVWEDDYAPVRIGV